MNKIEQLNATTDINLLLFFNTGFLYTCKFMYMNIYVCIYICIYIYTCLYLYAYILIYRFKYIYIYIFLFVNVCKYNCTQVPFAAAVYCLEVSLGSIHLSVVLTVISATLIAAATAWVRNYV
jgi:hypothetical protein